MILEDYFLLALCFNSQTISRRTLLFPFLSFFFFGERCDFLGESYFQIIYNFQ
jgi:hypothetical protein